MELLIGVLVAIAGITGLCFAFIWWGNQPVTNKGMKRSDMEPLMDRFLRDYEIGAIMTLSHEKSEKFLQFMKIEGANSGGSVKFGFPRVSWSDSRYEHFKGSVASDFLIKEYGPNSDVSGFFEVEDFGNPMEIKQFLFRALDYWAIPDGEFSVRIRGIMKRDAVKHT